MLIHPEFTVLQQGIHGGLQRFRKRAALNGFGSGLLRLLQNIQILCQIADVENGQTALSAAEEIAGAAQLQVLLRNAEAVLCGA